MAKTRPVVKILILISAVLTLCWIILIVYANIVPVAEEEDGIDVALLYTGTPREWYTLQQLNIVKVIGYSENATKIQVVYGIEGPPFETAGVIFEYEGKFWQISELHIDFYRKPSLFDYLRNYKFVGVISALLACCWILTAILLQRRKKLLARKIRGKEYS